MDEAGGRAWVIGEETSLASDQLTAEYIWTAEVGPFSPARWASALTRAVHQEDVIILPASPDGRDLAPRLAHVLGRPLLARAILIRPDRVITLSMGTKLMYEVSPSAPFVATLEPGSRGTDPRARAGKPALVHELTLDLGDEPDPKVSEVLPPDPASMDLSEAQRILAAGAGLGSAEACELLGRVAVALGASVGATRVVTDAGWLPHYRQIGTTGVSVHPSIYIALGISGAVQHIGGIGEPAHIVAVNVDPSCPMMAMADLAIVSDAPSLLRALATRLGVEIHE